MTERWTKWPWLTLQIIAANVVVILALAMAWYLAFMRQSDVYSERLMSTFNIEPGQLHDMYVADVERQLWTSVILGLIAATLVAVGLAFLIVRPLRSLAWTTERLRHGDYRVRSQNDFGEIGQLAGNINALAAALEQEERRRAQYLTDLGHELRTPITSLRGYTEGLEDGIFEANKEFYQRIKGELSQLAGLTHTIDTMSFCGADATQQQNDHAAVVGDFLQEAKTNWAARFQARGLKLELDIPKALAGREIAIPPNSLKQIADNLLSNMVRYAATDVPCKIVASRGATGNAIVLAFQNKAPDIDTGTLPFIFDRFFRLSKSRTRKASDHPTGLGLSIVKQICLSYRGNASAVLEKQVLSIRVEVPLKGRSQSLKRTKGISEAITGN